MAVAMFAAVAVLMLALHQLRADQVQFAVADTGFSDGGLGEAPQAFGFAVEDDDLHAILVIEMHM